MKLLSRPLLLIVLSALIHARSFGQGSIKGNVTNEKNISLASVIVRLNMTTDSAAWYKSLSTDQSGSFLFNNLPYGSYLVEIDLIGYNKISKPDIIISPKDTAINLGTITLSPSTKALSGVEIKAHATLIEKQIDKTVVNVDQNIANTGTNALELLKKLPGVQITTDGQITLNGKSGVNVTIDGKTTYLSADDLTSLLTNTPSSDIGKIEIMTNPSAKYDAEGTGGIINIIRKKNTKSGLNGTVTGSFGRGHFERENGSLVLNYKNDKYNLYLNNNYGYNKTLPGISNTVADIMNNNALLTQEVSTNSRGNTNRAYNSAAGIDLYLSKKTTLTVSGNVSAREATESINSLVNSFDSNHNQTGSENFAAINMDKPFNYTTGVQLVHKLDTIGRQWSAGADYSHYRYKPGQYNTTIDYDPVGNLLSQDNVFINELRTLHIFGARADYVRPLPGNGKIEAGLKSSYVKTNNNSNYYNQNGGHSVIDSALSDYNITSEDINAGYINFNKQHQKLTVQVGLRAEQTVMKGQQLFTDVSVNRNYFQLFPTIFLSDKLDEQNTLNFQFGRRTNRADYHELVPFRRPLSATLYFQGNPNLKPDLNWHSEVTWAWRNTVFITAAYDIDRDYVRTFPNLDSNKTTMTRIPTNVRGAHSWNVNISYNKELAKWFATNTTITVYQNSFNGSASGFSLDDPGFPTADLVSNNSFHCSDKLSMEADFEYESKRQFVGSIYPAYFDWSLALKQKILNGNGSITINANNPIVIPKFGNGTDHYLDLNQYGHSRRYAGPFMLTFNYRFGSGKLTKTQNKSGSEEEQKRAGG
ncbi:MAG TPA: outer membrane beta-barrel protein [Mucilaginibacter sp.]|nr:outer membrane beta-barrel protein [Mucilaginibacter sp.]